MHTYDPARGHGLRHDPLNAIVGPRPIGWVSSRDADGNLNLAPYSFFNLFNYRPPLVGFASIGWKDSARNVAATREFVWHLATRPLAEKMNATSATLPPSQSEFEIAGLTPVPSEAIGVPRVAEAAVAFECVLTDQYRLRDREGRELDTWMTFGQVVRVHLDDALVVDGAYDLAHSRTILRAGRGGDYVEVRPDAFFEMTRPP